ncbi:hypothetical protein [Thermococcus camini]|uniref:HEPN domain-containing protein n=1 Tax=Thermococcus camini TaxID=2016373 RepID=A0A7G2D797_9EURY|nr:hypothetical protein [Thermococcus camini]CAD5243507.1 conserved protein of unknown function [Thermococcus camini]
MEKELVEKVSVYINRAEHYAREKHFQMAHGTYMDALYAIGAYLVYRDMGILLPADQLVGVLRSRYPEVYDIIARYAGATRVDEATITALREDVERLRGMMTLPSPEG